MSSFKLGYLAWPAMIGLCGAWAFSGFMFTGHGTPAGFSDPVQSVRSQPMKPDFNAIDSKNIFKADISAVGGQTGALADDQSGAGQEADAQQPVLMGIVKGRYTSYAIVNSGGENIILRLGIPKNGFVLKKVRHDSADLLTDAGTLITLRFIQTQDDDQSQTDVPAPSQTAQPPVQNNAQPQSPGQPGQTAQPGQSGTDTNQAGTTANQASDQQQAGQPGAGQPGVKTDSGHKTKPDQSGE